jgi:hypothetical protein
MRLAATVILTAILAGPLQAATLVRSGEHQGFTRLVVYFDPGQAWELNKTEAGYQLVTEGLGEGFDLSQAYDLIGRDRVASMAASDDRLALEIACACEATTDVLSTGHLIIDIGEVGVVDTSLVQEPVPPSGRQPKAEDDQAEDTTAPAIALDLPVAPPILQLDNVALPAAPDQPDTAEQLTQFRQRLFANLGRSASLSLVTIDDPSGRDTLTPLAEELQLSLEPERPQRTEVSNAVDDALRSGALRAAPEASARCPEPEVFDIATWAGDAEFYEELSSIRRSLVGEFDQIDPRQALRLAQAYLHYGLVAEASHTVAQFDIPPGPGSVLNALAKIMKDDELAQREPALNSFLHCDGPILPWLLLDAPKTADLDDQRRAALVSEFARWPNELQDMLGQRLITALEFRGYETTASVLKEVIAGPQNQDTKKSPRASDQTQELLAAVEDGSERSIGALADYLRQSIDAGANIAPDQLELAAAFERETYGLPVSNRLRALRFEAMAYQGEIELLMAEIEREDQGFASLENEAVSRIAGHIAALDDAQKLALFTVFSERQNALGRFPPDVLKVLAERHLDMGLPNIAARLLQDYAVPAQSPDLRARLAMSLGRVDEALDTLAELPAGDTAAQQADLLLRNSRASQLAREDRDALPSALRDRVAWATSDWENVGGQDSQEEMSRLIVSLQSTDLSQAPLTGAKELRDQSEAARALLSELLGQTGE